MESTLLVLDTETGGTDPNTHSLLSLAGVAWSRENIGETVSMMIGEPEIVAEPEALQINRIDIAKLRIEGLRPDQAVDALETFISTHFRTGEKVVLAGHNVSFDIGFLKRLYRLAGRNYERTFSHRSLDTASVLRFLVLAEVLPLDEISSEAAFAFFHTSPPKDARHTALGDALATAHLISELAAFVAAPHGA